MTHPGGTSQEKLPAVHDSAHADMVAFATFPKEIWTARTPFKSDEPTMPAVPSM